MSTTTHTASIHAWNLGALQERVAEYSRRAERLGLEPLTLTTGERYTEVVDNVRIPRIEVTITGEAPRLGGWFLLASIDHQAEGNVIRSVPGSDVDLVQYRESAPWCDHCQTTRRRSQTFVVRSASEGMKRVGRSCLRDFLGHTAIDALLDYAEFLSDEIGSEWIEAPLPGRRPDELTLDEYLPWVAMAIRRLGWVSKRDEMPEIGRYSTSHSALVWLDKSMQCGYRGSRPSEQDRTDASAAVECILSLAGDISDYEHNLRVIARAGECRWRDTGFAASMLPYYYRAVERELERQKLAARPSRHIGTVGEKLEVKCEVVGIRSMDGRYGTTTLYTFRTPDGDDLKWFSSKDVGISRGDTVVLSGRVKAHDEYKDRAQTVVTRCKVRAS